MTATYRQDDLLASVEAGPPVPVLEQGAWRGQPRVERLSGARCDCAWCWRDQHAAGQAGTRVPRRQQAMVRITEPGSGELLLCGKHRQEWADARGVAR